MDERTHELITAFLLRDTTPEQERELFAACMRDPGLAALLRDEMALSLKLRSLRDATVVPEDLAAELKGRINLLEAESARAVRARRWAMPTSFSLPRFSWAQLSAAATVPALAVALFFLLRGGDAPLPAPTAATITVVRTDTLTRVREVRTPVYIVRRESAPSTTVAATAGGGAERSGIAETAAAPTGENVATPQPVAVPEIAQSERERSYLDQYNEMLVTVESIHISDGDRIRN